VLFSESVLPSTFAKLSENFLYGNNPHLWGASILMLIAIGIICLMNKYSVTTS
jgi:hypothetical protein